MTQYKADDLLNAMPDAVAELANRVRLTIMEHTPDCDEATIPAAKSIHYILQGPDYIPGPFLTLALTPRSIKLHFLYGDQLSDPDRLLEGFGGRQRIAAIQSVDDAQHPGLIGLIDQARKLRKR
ncbi:MAG: hypothetical protein KI792_09370 [Alphaproteobacteria bacterium]|nr:hypothetical protein [Alphaproteobacteria bacterium SS10]